MSQTLMTLRVKFFASHDIEYLSTAHDVNLVGDTRTTLRINYEWRLWIIGLIEVNRFNYLQSIDEPLLTTIENWFDGLIEDLYD